MSFTKKEGKMTINEVSKKFGVSQDTLRYYEKIGLIAPVLQQNGRRNYSQKDIDELEFIFCMRSAGLPIKLLKQYIDLCRQGAHTAEQRKTLLIAQRKELEEKIAEMQTALQKLNYKIDVYYPKLLEREKNFGGH